MSRQRYTFRFYNSETYKEEMVVLVGMHYDDAKSGAWAVLSEVTHDSNPRAAWRLVSTAQEPIWHWHALVASS